MSQTIQNEIFITIDKLNSDGWDLNRKDPKKAIETATIALSESEKVNYLKGIAQSKKTLGACSIWLSNNEEAVDYTFAAMQLFKELELPDEEAQCNYNLGTNFYYLSDYDNALRYFIQCFRINENNNNLQGIADGLNGMGTVYYSIDDNEKAIESLSKSITICKKIKDYIVLPKALDGIGNAYANLGKYEEALSSMFECLDVLKSYHSNKQVEAFALNGIGNIYFKKKDFENAHRYFNESLNLRREIGFKVGEATTLERIGRLYLEENNSENAMDFFHASIELSKEINSKESLYKSYEGLSKAYEKFGNIAAAYENYQLFHVVKEEARSEKADRRSKGLELQFKVEQAEVEKNLLENKNKELKKYFEDVITLSEIGKRITSLLSVDQIINTVYESVNKLIDATCFGIGVLTDDGKSIVFPGYMEKGQKLPEAYYPLEDDDRLAIRCFKHTEEIVIGDYENELVNYVSSYKKAIVGELPSSVIYLPLFVKDKKIGVITVQSFEKNAYQEYQVNILRNLAVYAAIGIENASLYQNLEDKIKERTKEIIEQKEQLQASFENTRLLGEMGQEIISTHDIESIFFKLQNNINKLMDATCFSIRLYNPEDRTIDYQYTIEKGKRLDKVTVSMDDIDNYSVWCVTHKKSIFINDHAIDYKKYTNKIVVVTGDLPESLLFCPMMIGEKVVGVITVQAFVKNAYSPYHLDILKTLGAYTAIALENALLYESLEDRVRERTAEVVKQKEIIQEKNKDITDSINYALKIQKAILPSMSEVKRILPNSFVFYKPKDIVSGDFYWCTQIYENIVFAVADCTGHGVPGAMMSAICNNLMTQVIHDGKISNPAIALEQIDKKLTRILNQSDSNQKSRDSMDIALCTIDKNTNKLHFSGVNRPLVIIRNGKLIEYKPDKFSLGDSSYENKIFNLHEIDLLPNDLIYIFSDGFPDQFGGDRGKKFKYRQLIQLLIEIQGKTMEEQYDLIDNKLINWMGDLEQLDDVLVMGVQIV